MDTSAGRTPYEARPLIGLISDLWRETSRLIHAEVELATVEISEKVSEVRTGLISIAVGAVMFGLVHYRGGWTYTLVQTLAGAGFGWAYHRTKRVEAAMAVHFGFDSLQFLLFTFPALE